MGWTAVSTLGDLLVRTAAASPEQQALVLGGTRLSYPELETRARNAARSLSALGVGRGDHVGLLMPNCPEFVELFFGIQLLGAVAVPVNTRFRVRELSHVIAHADLTVLVTSDIVEDHVSFIDRIHETLPELRDADTALPLALAAAPQLRHVVALGRTESPGMVSESRFREIADRVDPMLIEACRERVRVRDVALILFTSGTTAQPKGCLLTHEAVGRTWISVAERLRITGQDRVFDALPMYHMSCLGPLIFTVAAGGTLITMVHFDAEEALDLIVGERATWLYTVFPTVTMELIRHPGFADRDLSAVRGLMNVGPPDALRVMQRAFPDARQVPGHFGMTEAAGAITCADWEGDDEELFCTTGRPLPGTEVRAVGPNGEPIPPGTTGELWLRGPGVMQCYHREPAATAATLDAEGWVHSGDIGTVDERGRVVYAGRLKDMLKVGGENVSPSEVESHLSTHPAVKLVQVVGAPDERLEEVAAAFVELTIGHELTADQVIEYCRGALASYKVPRHVRFVTEWPMSATKIQKFRLREQLAAELQATTTAGWESR